MRLIKKKLERIMKINKIDKIQLNGIVDTLIERL